VRICTSQYAGGISPHRIEQGPMYDLFLVALLFCAQHIAIAYAAIEIWKLDYQKYLMVTTGISLVLAIILKVLMAGWKDRIDQALKGEWEDRELLVDVILFFLTMMAGGAVSAYLVYRRFGITGWAGALAVNYAASWIV
jgi:hypothetical protein